MEDTTLRSKSLYKATLFILKILPMVIAFSFFFNTLCAYLQLPFQVITHYLGITVAPLVFMYVCSYVFRFCNYHRIFIHYVAIVELLNITDWYFGIPLSNKEMCWIHFIISAIFAIIAIIMYVKRDKKPSCINNR